MITCTETSIWTRICTTTERQGNRECLAGASRGPQPANGPKDHDGRASDGPAAGKPGDATMTVNEPNEPPDGYHDGHPYISTGGRAGWLRALARMTGNDGLTVIRDPDDVAVYLIRLTETEDTRRWELYEVDQVTEDHNRVAKYMARVEGDIIMHVDMRADGGYLSRGEHIAMHDLRHGHSEYVLAHRQWTAGGDAEAAELLTAQSEKNVN